MTFNQFTTSVYFGRNSGHDVAIVHTNNASSPTASLSNVDFYQTVHINDFTNAIKKISNPDETVIHAWGI